MFWYCGDVMWCVVYGYILIVLVPQRWSGQLPVFHCQDTDYQVYCCRHCQIWAGINCKTGKAVTTWDSLSFSLFTTHYSRDSVSTFFLIIWYWDWERGQCSEGPADGTKSCLCLLFLLVMIVPTSHLYISPYSISWLISSLGSAGPGLCIEHTLDLWPVIMIP